MVTGHNSDVGTRFKVNLHMDKIDGQSLESLEWEAVVFVESDATGKTIIIPKDRARKVDADNYIIPVDSSKLGAGRYWITLVAHIPDADFEDGIRTERKKVFTGVTIDPR